MFTTGAVFVGIDPTAGRRPMQWAALDGDLHLLALETGDLEGVLSFVSGLESAVLAVDTPQSPNQGLMRKPEIRRRYHLLPGGKTWGDWKVCEYELRRRNIRLYNTPGAEEAAPGWMRNGFFLYRRLREMGYEFLHKGEDLSPRALIEVHPHACFTVIIGRRPFLKKTLEGRLQRQLILYLEGIEIPNPMRCLQEITRHHLLQSHLPLDELCQHDQLDAMVAAYTAYLIAKKPERVCQVGERGEGLITVPTGALKDFYR